MTGPKQQPEPQGLLSPISVRTTGERIAERFVTAIALGQFVPGQRLPTERELAAMLGVSRATVREAIARLAESGYVTVRRGRYRDGLAMLEEAMSDLRGVGMDAYAELAQSWIAEAEAFGGDPFRALDVASQELSANDRQRPLLTRMGAIALARLGQKEAAMRELRHSLETARARSSEYDIAATIDVMAAVAPPDADLVRERDEILERLKIKQLPLPALSASTA